MKELTVAEAERALLDMPQVPCPITHTFMPGIYIRQMEAPAGTFLVGHEHKTHHMCMLLKGKLELRNDNGTATVLEAPMIFEGKPGRKIAVALTDVIFCNLHATNETDVSKIEDALINKSEVWLEHQRKIEGEK